MDDAKRLKKQLDREEEERQRIQKATDKGKRDKERERSESRDKRSRANIRAKNVHGYTSADEIRRIAKAAGINNVIPKQVDWLCAYFNSEPGTSDADVSRRAGVKHTQACNWWRAEKWVNLVIRVAEARAAKGLPIVWKALERKASTGDVRAIALYLQRFDSSIIHQLRDKATGVTPPVTTEEEKKRRADALKVIQAAQDKRREGNNPEGIGGPTHKKAV